MHHVHVKRFLMDICMESNHLSLKIVIICDLFPFFDMMMILWIEMFPLCPISGWCTADGPSFGSQAVQIGTNRLKLKSFIEFCHKKIK